MAGAAEAGTPLGDQTPDQGPGAQAQDGEQTMQEFLEMRSLGIWRADDETALHEEVLDTLPLRSWMTLKVSALQSHPNDPGKDAGAR